MKQEQSEITINGVPITKMSKGEIFEAVTKLNAQLEGWNYGNNDKQIETKGATLNTDKALKVFSILEDERKAISRTIHDEIGGKLAAIKILMETRLSRCDRPPLECIMSLEEIIMHLKDTIQETKRIAHQLHPIGIEDFGLTTAIRNSIRTFKKDFPNIDIQFQTNYPLSCGQKDLETLIYWVVQEAINNICKKSSADCIMIDLLDLEGSINFKLEDNGDYFDVTKSLGDNPPLECYGLSCIKERVELCKGDFRVEYTPDKGTVLSVSLPKSPSL